MKRVEDVCFAERWIKDNACPMTVQAVWHKDAALAGQGSPGWTPTQRGSGAVAPVLGEAKGVEGTDIRKAAGSKGDDGKEHIIMNPVGGGVQRVNQGAAQSRCGSVRERVEK